MLTMRYKKAITKELRDRYQRAFKKERVLGYLNITGKRIKYVADKKMKREKKRFYDKEVFIALKRTWIICDYICSSGLPPIIRTTS